MPAVQLSDHTFKRLQPLATPFVDEPEDVVARLLDIAADFRPATPPNEIPQGAHRSYDPRTPPPSTHTKLLKAAVNGRLVTPPRWNQLLDATLQECAKSASKIEDVIARSLVNVVTGSRSDSGYRYLADLGISVQGQDAADAWNGVVGLASAFGVRVEAEFIWRANKKAAFPGTGGVMRLSGR